jgi:hypothetical protein
MAKFYQHHHEAYLTKGYDAIMLEIEQYLRNKYSLHPATIDGSPLPLHPGEIYEDERDVYCENIYHSAFMYLFDPILGRFDDPDNREPSGIFDNTSLGISNKKSIAHMWVAIPNNREDAKEKLIKKLAKLHRLHNWDHIEENDDHVLEKCTDYQGNKPAFRFEVKRELYKSMNNMFSSNTHTLKRLRARP